MKFRDYTIFITATARK